MKYLFSILLVLIASVTEAKNDNDSASIIKKIDKQESYTLEEEPGDKPEAKYLDYTYSPQISHFNVPLDIEVKAIQNAVNTAITDLIYEDNNIEDDSLMVKVRKDGSFLISFDNNQLTATVPLKIWAKKRFGIMGLSYTDREVNARIKVLIKSKLQIGKNWNILSKSEISNYEWVEQPTTSVAGVNVPITFIVDKVLSKNKKKLESALDNAIATNIPTKSYANDLWTEVQQSIPVQADSYKAWIRIQPSSILLKPLTGNNNIISTGFKIDCKVNVDLNKPSQNKVLSLPECKLTSALTPGFDLNLLANIPYSIVDSVAYASLKGEPFGEGRHTIYVDTVNTYGQNDSIVIGLKIHGFVNGKIYLIGKPYFDQQNNSLRLREVSYKLKTKNILHKAINLIIKPILKNKIEKKLEVPLQENFYLIQQMANSKVMNSQWTTNVFTKGQITSIKGRKIYISPAGVQVDLSIVGELNVMYK